MVDLSSNDALGSALARVRLHGSVFSRSEIRAPWGVGSGPLPHAVCAVIVEGEAHLALGGRHQAQRTLRAGDVVLVRAGIPLTLRDSPSSAVVSLERFALSQGRRRGGRITRLVCTSLELDAVGKDLLGSALPAVVQLSSLDAGPATRAIVDALTTEVTHPSVGTEVMVTRLSELLFLQCLHHCIEQGTVTAGWLQGLRHPAMAKVLARIHVDPGREWTVESLARIAGMSRSVFASTFRKTVGETPLGYLMAWRMRPGFSRTAPRASKRLRQPLATARMRRSRARSANGRACPQDGFGRRFPPRVSEDKKDPTNRELARRAPEVGLPLAG